MSQCLRLYAKYIVIDLTDDEKTVLAFHLSKYGSKLMINATSLFSDEFIDKSIIEMQPPTVKKKAWADLVEDDKSILTENANTLDIDRYFKLAFVHKMTKEGLLAYAADEFKMRGREGMTTHTTEKELKNTALVVNDLYLLVKTMLT